MRLLPRVREEEGLEQSPEPQGFRDARGRAGITFRLAAGVEGIYQAWYGIREMRNGEQ